MLFDTHAHLDDHAFDADRRELLAALPGQGIGLNLARRLVAEQGGSLRLADEVERGSRFVITLPAARVSDEYDDVRAC